MVVERLPVGAEGNLPHRTVVARISAVHVARQAAAQERMVQARIELHSTILGAAGDFQAAEGFFPQAERLLLGAIEIHPGGLGFQVGLRVVDRGIGQADFRDDLVPLFHGIVQGEDGAGTGNRCGTLPLPAHMEGGGAVRHPGQFPVEEHLHRRTGLILLHILGLGDDMALDDVSIQFRIGVTDSAALPHPGAHVHEDMTVAGLPEGETLEPHAGCCGEFGLDAIVLEQDTVVTRPGGLIGLVEGRAPARGRVFQTAGNGQGLAGDRHQGQTAHLEFVEARESVDGRMRILIAHGLPALVVSVSSVGGSAQLGHSEGNGGRGIDEPAAVDRADIGVHIGRIILLLAAGEQAQAGRPGGDGCFSHFFSPLYRAMAPRDSRAASCMSKDLSRSGFTFFPLQSS